MTLVLFLLILLILAGAVRTSEPNLLWLLLVIFVLWVVFGG